MEMDIKITEHDAKILSHWASIGRTFDNIERLLSRIILEDETDDSNRNLALEELEELHRPLENLHMAWRSEKWRIDEQAKKDIIARSK